MSNNAGGSNSIHPFLLSSPVLGGGNFYHTSAMTLNSSLDKVAISFIARESGSLDYLKAVLYTTTLNATSIVFSVFEDLGAGPSTVQVGSDVSIPAYSGTVGESVQNINLSPGIGPLVKDTRYWLVVKLAGWSAGSLTLCAWVDHVNLYVSNTTLDLFVYRSEEGAAWANANIGFALMTMRIGNNEFGAPIWSIAGLGSGSTIGSATLNNDYCFMPGFPFPISVRGVAGTMRRCGTPTATPFFRLVVGGEQHDTVPIPAVSSFLSLNGYGKALSFFEKTIVIPPRTPIGVGLGCTGESAGNYWSLGAVATTFTGMFGGLEWWSGWRNNNGVITQKRMPAVGFFLDPVNPIPQELNRRQFFGGR